MKRNHSKSCHPEDLDDCVALVASGLVWGRDKSLEQAVYEVINFNS